VAHFRLKDGDRIGLVVHHLVIDGVSWRILLEDLSTLYAAYITGEKPELPQKTDAFQKWASAQNDYANSKALLNERSYWEGISTSEITALPQDIEVSNQVTRINAATSFYLDRGTTETLQTRVHQVYRTEINDVLLTALGLALRETFKVDKVALKMEGHGREDIFEHIDINRTIGWFTTVYPFVLDVSKSSNEIKNLLEIKESLRKIPNKGIGYGMLKYLSQQGLANELTPEITFNYLGDFGSNTGNSEKSLFEYGSEYFGANIGADNRNDSILDVSGMLVQGELSLSIGYSSERYHEETIKGLAASYKKNLELIIETLAAERTTHLTPSDLTFKGLTTDELSKLNSDGNVEDIYELSPLQEGIYYHWLNDESPTLYLEQKTYRIKAKNLSIENLKTAYERLINRYGALRTHFTNNYANKPLQVVLKQVESSFNFVMAPFGSESNKFADEVKQKDRLLGFDLEQGIQMRLTIVQLSKEEYEFIWSHHHILMDGWCISVLISDFNQLFYALTNGVTTNLSAITPYSNYINWLKKINRENSLGFWKKYLENYDTVAGLPFKVKSQEGGYSEGKESVSITGEIFQKVNALCVQIGITQNTYVQGVWGYLLSRYNNTNDAVFGAVVSGRPADLEGVEDMIGLFSNAVPIRVKYQPNDTPIELLKSLQDRSIESEAHHYLNLSEVQSQSELGMDLINHIMLFQNYAVKEVSEVNEIQEGDDGNLHIESVEDFNQNNYDFTIVINPIQDGLNIEFRYNSNLYANGVLKYLVKHMYNLVSLFSLQPTSELKSFEFLSEFERDKLLYTFNRDEKAYPKDKTIIDLFEEQVAKNPESSAIVFEGRTLTYKELNNKANQLAHYLVVNNEIESEDLVGILLERGIWQIIAILGVLKSGGAYVPIDPDLPVERKEFMIEDTGIKTLITESSFVNDIDFYDEAVVAIDIELDEEVLVDFDRNQSKTLPNNAAYVIYTSGSTGQPKGTIIEHKALCNLCSWHTKAYQLNSTSRATIMAGVAFDASVWELFPYLISGGCLYPISNETRLDLGKLIETMNDHEITHAYLPTVLYNDFFEQSSRLKRIVKLYVGGEALSVNQQGEMIELYNNYGPTENTVVASYYKVRKEDRGPIPIGQPIDNTSIYILNNENQLQPIGVIGEISIGGDGLARAYLNRPELTNEKFIENPFKTDEKIYKTGDLGRWTHEGNIEFVGRLDDQVKIRGYRIELGEIEHALSKFDGIDQAVVLAKANKHGVHELVAYLTSENAQNVIEIRTHLKEHLPAYMLPTHYVKLDAFSLTSNGKIDKKSLPDPDGIGVSSGEDYVPPRNEIEEKLVLIWSETLERENIGIKDDFFVMGGNSIKILNVLSRINQVFDIELKTRNLFETRSIEDLSVLVDFAIVQKEKGSMIDNMNEIEI
jgi:amino acid adenylation domain-containing protein/non-ribosomal peptide synthase protein (TIGR01720 family)